MLGAEDAILDGEAIAADETGRPQFYDLLRHARMPAYVAFDMLWADGADLRSLPLSERRQRLHAVLPKGSAIVPSAAWGDPGSARRTASRSAIVSEALSVVGRGRELFELMRAHDLEGIVAKRLDDPYDPRVRWFKIKNPDYSQKEGRGDLFNGPRDGK